MDLLLFDTALRGALVGIAFVCVSAFWINGAPRETRIAFTLMAIAGLSRTWGNLPAGTELTADVTLALRYVGTLSLPLFTWNFIVLFMDDRRYFWAWIGGASVVTVGLWLGQIDPRIGPFLRAYAGAFTIFFMFVLVLSYKDDLINKRRRARLWVASCVVVHILVVVLLTTPMYGEETVIEPMISAAFQLFSYCIFTFWAIARSQHTWILEQTHVANAKKSTKLAKPAQLALVRQIEVAMQNEIWRKEGLTVGELAQKVGMPEHQVRSAINQILGHRNFSAFINQARIEAAKKQLAAEDSMGVSVQEIAYSVGFSSIGPFNRTFREDTGQSPSDYRNAALAAALADS